MNLSLRRSGDTLHATLAGAFNLAEAQGTFLRILDTVEDNDVAKVLVDGRAVTGQLTATDRFDYGNFVANAVVESSARRARQAPKFAYVLLEPIIDKQRLGEIVAINRGMNVGTFDNLEDALKWLG